MSNSSTLPSSNGTGYSNDQTSSSSQSSSSTGNSCSHQSSPPQTRHKCKCKKVQVDPKGPNTFKVVQMTGIPPQCGGVIGYMYTYEVRQKHRLIRKNVQPYQPFKIVVVREESEHKDNDSVRHCPELKIKEANAKIACANQQIAKALIDKKKAQERKEKAERLQIEQDKVKRRLDRSSM